MAAYDVLAEKPMWSTTLPALGVGFSFLENDARLANISRSSLPSLADRRDSSGTIHGLDRIRSREVHVVDYVCKTRLGGDLRRHKA